MKEIIIKKPQQSRSKQKFSAILAACPRVLQEFGFKKSTAAKMALEADVSIGTFYDYFSCKEAVYIAYLDSELNKALDKVAKKAGSKNMAAKELLRQLITAGVDFAFQQREIIKIAFNHFPDQLHVISLEKSREKLQKIALAFAHNQPIHFTNKDPELMMYTLTNIILGFQFRIVVMPNDGFSKDVIVDELTDIMANYILA
ncbi:MAG: TetR/AcrR family transcriptional regulator [Pseudomonadales bacterium]|nr:TetR/AcrR family transcriptional regulator [Pseudomonadales bacterium]